MPEFRVTAVRRAVRLALGVTASTLMLVGVSQPASGDQPANKGRCVSELAKAGLIGKDLNPGKANFIIGTEGDDVFDPSMMTDGVDVICGFGGNDHVDTLGEVGDSLETGVFPGSRDVFLGGAGNDSVRHMFGGTFYGGTGDDSVLIKSEGTVYGEAGNDLVTFNDRGLFVGGDGDDTSTFSGAFGATFEGGAGNDHVEFLQAFTGTALFNGNEGDDSVNFLLTGGVFNGGPGNDTVLFNSGGTFNQ